MNFSILLTCISATLFFLFNMMYKMYVNAMVCVIDNAVFISLSLNIGLKVLPKLLWRAYWSWCARVCPWDGKGTELVGGLIPTPDPYLGMGTERERVSLVIRPRLANTYRLLVKVTTGWVMRSSVRGAGPWQSSSGQDHVTGRGMTLAVTCRP